MSFAALAWAAKQKTGGLATKSVLLALANYADEHGCAYPSTAAIAAFGEMDHKTATSALDRLAEAGLISDTGERAGRTKQVKIYKLHLESQPETEAFQKRKPPVSEPKAPQKRGTDTIKEPVSQKATPSSNARAKMKPFRLPDDWKPTRFADDTIAREIIDRRGQEWARHQIECFRNWAANAEDKPGKGRKTDWQAAFGNWILREDKDGSGRQLAPSRAGNSASGMGRTVDAAERFLARRAARH